MAEFDYWCEGRPYQSGIYTIVDVGLTDYSQNYHPSIVDDVWEQIWAWCQNNCSGAYLRLRTSVAFHSPEDAVLFHIQHILSDTYLPWIERK